jgi:cysteine desulfuration protein SufE
MGQQSRRADRKVGVAQASSLWGRRASRLPKRAKCAKLPLSMYPTKLNSIINLFEMLPEDERRETLVSYADNAKKQEPREGEKFELIDVRKDEECMDTVGVYLHVDKNGKAQIRMTLGPEVQTLTRSMSAILCKGLEGSTPAEILDLPSDFVTRIVGAELVRIRSQTIYYVLTRIKSICKVYLDRQRMAEVA